MPLKGASPFKGQEEGAEKEAVGEREEEEERRRRPEGHHACYTQGLNPTSNDVYI